MLRLLRPHSSLPSPPVSHVADNKVHAPEQHEIEFSDSHHRDWPLDVSCPTAVPMVADLVDAAFLVVSEKNDCTYTV